MSDIVERLRELSTSERRKYGVPADVAMDEAAAEIDRLRAENERLRAALRPFAEAADGFDATRIENPEEWFVHHGIASDTDDAKGAITVGDLRRARAELEETNE